MKCLRCMFVTVFHNLSIYLCRFLLSALCLWQHKKLNILFNRGQIIDFQWAKQQDKELFGQISPVCNSSTAVHIHQCTTMLTSASDKTVSHTNQNFSVLFFPSCVSVLLSVTQATSNVFIADLVLSLAWLPKVAHYCFKFTCCNGCDSLQVTYMHRDNVQ